MFDACMTYAEIQATYNRCPQIPPQVLQKEYERRSNGYRLISSPGPASTKSQLLDVRCVIKSLLKKIRILAIQYLLPSKATVRSASETYASSFLACLAWCLEVRVVLAALRAEEEEEA